MATGISTLLIIVSAFVNSGISSPCHLENDTDNTYYCVLSNEYVQECCLNGDNCVLTQFIQEPMHNVSVMNITGLRLKDLTLENCVKPLVIEHILTVEIIHVTFRGFNDSVLDIFNVSNVMVDNCTFENNFKNGSGTKPFRGNAGAIAVGYSNCSRDGNCSDINRNANCLVDNSTYESYSIIIRNSMFINNSARSDTPTDKVLIQKIFSGRGGAVALYLPTPYSKVRFLSESNFFMNNEASSAGGGIYAHLSGDYADVTLHVKDCNFIENKAKDGAGIEFTYDLRRSTCMASGSCEIDDIKCSFQEASTVDCENYFPANSIIENCSFTANDGDFGGAFKGIQINPFGNNNLIRFKNCTFINNTASVGAGAYFQSRYSVADVRMNNSIQMENCSFMSNVGSRSIVFMIRNRVDFIGENTFINNTGPSIRLVGTLVVFNGTVLFENNRHHSEGLSGALYLSSFGQMLLAENARLNFIGNIGSDGAAIVVKSPRVSSSFSRQLYNPQCFLQYASATDSPMNWTAKLMFAGNKARVGPVMFVSNLAACEWYSINSSQYFLEDEMERWGQILNISNEDCNCIINSNNSCSSTSGSCDNTVLIQTELSELDLDQNLIIEKSPGENVQVHLGVLDERRNQTIAFLKIDIDDDANDNDTEDECDVIFEPSIIPVSPEDESINFKFRSTGQECEQKSINIAISAPFAINPVEPKIFTLRILECLPGFELVNTSDDYYQCNCNTESDVLYCSPDQTTILLKDGTWAAKPEVSGGRKLITSPCPAGYCECNGVDGLTSSGCALNFSKSICVDKREGWLCGECKNLCNDSESGIGVLTTQCRCSQNEMYSYLVPLVVLYGIVATSIIVFVNYPFPNSLKGILYYIQVSAICTQFVPESFNIQWEIMDCIANALSFYFPYDFDFKPGLTAIDAFGLRYIPIAIVAIIAPIALWIRTRFHPRMVFEGIWTLMLLTYAHFVYTSSSIVNCRQLDGKLRWFINGNILCYHDEHLGLAILAIISLIIAAVLILFTGFIIYQKKIKYVSTLPDRVQLMASNFRSTLINGYRPNYIFWPVIELLRRFIFITAVVCVPGDLTLPLLLTLIVFGAHVFVYPYDDKLSNHIESFVLFVLITVLMLGNTTAVVERTRSRDEDFFILLFVPIYIAFLLLVCYLIYRLCCLMKHRFNINVMNWNLAKQSGLLNRKKNNRTDSVPQVTCTHIDLIDHDYQPLPRPNHDEGDNDDPQTRSSHNVEDDGN